jgi:hypothetical protein
LGADQGHVPTVALKIVAGRILIDTTTLPRSAAA